MDKKRKQDSIEHSSSDFVTLNTTTNHILFKRQFAHVEVTALFSEQLLHNCEHFYISNLHDIS